MKESCKSSWSFWMTTFNSVSLSHLNPLPSQPSGLVLTLLVWLPLSHCSIRPGLEIFYTSYNIVQMIPHEEEGGGKRKYPCNGPYIIIVNTSSDHVVRSYNKISCYGSALPKINVSTNARRTDTCKSNWSCRLLCSISKNVY